MNYSILTQESLGNNNWFIELELLPDNDFESQAIQNYEAGKATDVETEMLENQLQVALKGMTLLNLVRQRKNVFAVTAASR